MLNQPGALVGVGLFGVAALLFGGLLGIAVLGNPKRALMILFVARTLTDWGVLGSSISYLLNQLVVGSAIVGAIVCARNIPTVLLRWERGFVAYLVLGFGIAAVGQFTTEAANSLIRPISYFAIAHIAVATARSYGVKATYRAIVLASVPAALLVLSGLVGVPGMASGARPRGTFAHPNIAGAFMALAGVLALSLAIESPSWRRAALAVLFPIAMVSSLSADSAIAYAAGVGVVIFSTTKRSVLIRSLIVIVGVLVLGAALPFISVTGKIAHAFQGISLTQIRPGQQNSLQWRFNNWHLLIDQWKEHPWFGFGLGSTDSFLQPLHAPPHSEYVRVLCETGLVGCVLMLILLVGLVRFTFRHGPHRLPVGGRAVIFALLCDALAANSMEYTPVMFLFAAVVGASMVVIPVPEEPAGRLSQRRYAYRPASVGAGALTSVK